VLSLKIFVVNDLEEQTSDLEVSFLPKLFDDESILLVFACCRNRVKEIMRNHQLKCGFGPFWEFGSGDHSMVPQQSGSTELQRQESACLAGAVAELVPSAEADSISPSPSRHCRAGLSHVTASRLS
jgi:hypothetical protein